MLPIEARVGLAQLQKYDWMISRRHAHAARYEAGLRGVPGWVLPPAVEGATYSHYPVRVPDRQAAVDHFARHGVHLGEVVEYSVAHLSAYTRFANGEFPNSLYCSRHMINLPLAPWDPGGKGPVADRFYADAPSQSLNALCRALAAMRPENWRKHSGRRSSTTAP